MIKQMEGQVSLSDVDGWCGRMFKELSVREPQKEKTSASCLKKSQKSQMKVPLFLDLRTENGHQVDASWETDGQSLGCFMMHSSTAHLKGAEEYVCVCADFNGESAPRILFELRRKTANTESDKTFTDPGMGTEHGEVQTFTEGLSRNLEPSGAQGQGVAEDSEGCANPSSFTLKIRGGEKSIVTEEKQEKEL